MKYVKYGAIRDFRIEGSQLMQNLEKMNVSLVCTIYRNIYKNNK